MVWVILAVVLIALAIIYWPVTLIILGLIIVLAILNYYSSNKKSKPYNTTEPKRRKTPKEKRIEDMKKWYPRLVVICVLFCFSFLIVPLIVGVILLLKYRREYGPIFNKCNDLQEAEEMIADKKHEFDSMIAKKQVEIIELDGIYKEKESKCKSAFEVLNKEYDTKTDNLDQEFKAKTDALNLEYYKKEKAWRGKVEHLEKEYNALTESTLIEHYRIADYDGLTSEECKNQISLLQVREQDLIKNGGAFKIGYVESKKIQSSNTKQIIRCFNAECSNILVSVTTKNINTLRSKTQRVFESLNKIFEVDSISLLPEMLECKLEQLNLAYTYEVKREQERETQREIKAQMLEEEKVRREIEQEKKKIEKDQAQFTNEVNRLMKYLQKSENDVEKQLYIDKIKELEDKLKELETRKADVLEREVNARAGFVYVISNIGSFGENVYKIGMTRRLEPMDRIKELSSASVPFEFDVHAMIFSDNAPELENTLHKYFEKNSVNKVNPRKEFFKVTIDEIEKITKEKYNNTVEFIEVPVAKEYRQTLELERQEAS